MLAVASKARQENKGFGCTEHLSLILEDFLKYSDSEKMEIVSTVTAV